MGMGKGMGRRWVKIEAGDVKGDGLGMLLLLQFMFMDFFLFL